MLADASESGPFGLLHSLRELFGLRYYDEEPYHLDHTDKWIYGITSVIFCHKCSALWIAAAFVVLMVVNLEVAFYTTLPFAINEASNIVNKYV